VVEHLSADRASFVVDFTKLTFVGSMELKPRHSHHEYKGGFWYDFFCLALVYFSHFRSLLSFHMRTLPSQ
jgi:hypothetical protein